MQVVTYSVSEGTKVVRGRDWDYGDEDKGTAYGVVVQRYPEKERVEVMWISKEGREIFYKMYRAGYDGKFDLYCYQAPKFRAGDAVILIDDKDCYYLKKGSRYIVKNIPAPSSVEIEGIPVYLRAIRFILDESDVPMNKEDEPHSITKDCLVGCLTNFPLEVVEYMLVEQELQVGERDVSVFQKDTTACRLNKGFTWDYSVMGRDFWRRVISSRDFDYFFSAIKDKTLNHLVSTIEGINKKYTVHTEKTQDVTTSDIIKFFQTLKTNDNVRVENLSRAYPSIRKGKRPAGCAVSGRTSKAAIGSRCISYKACRE